MCRLAALFAAWSSLAISTSACECLPTPSRGLALRASELVFVGTALSYGPTDVYGAPGRPLYAVTFDVEELIGGRAAHRSAAAQRDTVRLTLEQGQGVDCRFSFDPGKRYLVYADRTDFGLFDASDCGRTALAEDAQEEIAALRADIVAGSVGYRPPRHPAGGGYVEENAFDSLATYAARSERRGHQRLAWSVGFNAVLALCLAWAAGRAFRRRAEAG